MFPPFAQIAPDANENMIGDITGAWQVESGIQFNDQSRIVSTGYPADGAFNTPENGAGLNQYRRDTTWDGQSWLPKNGGFDLWLTCPMGRGASGGPWFVLVDNNRWVIGGVNNWCNDDNKADDTDPNSYCTRCRHRCVPRCSTPGSLTSGTR